MKAKLQFSAPEPKQYVVLNDMVLARRHSPVDETMSPVQKIASEVAGTVSNKGTIVSISPLDPDLKTDDIVLFSEHAANDIELDGEKFVLLHRRQIYLKL